MPHRELISDFSHQLVTLQAPIRILDAVAWDEDVAADFFASEASRQPRIDVAYYTARRPLPFDPVDLDSAFSALRERIQNNLGDASAGRLLVSRIDEYRQVVAMLEARGTPRFAELAAELYGSANDCLYPGGPTLASLGALISDSLSGVDTEGWEPPNETIYTAQEAVTHLGQALSGLCGEQEVRVIIDDGIVSDAAAGSDYIKLRADATFSSRDLRVLEVHEGWVHVATSLNGRRQPICSFLGKGTPSTTSTQEGLAVFTEVTTLSSTPERLRKITRRMLAIEMAENGATFLDVFRWFVDEGLSQDDAWVFSVRVFRGSTPEAGPFTKDLVYSRGFLEVYDFIRLAVKRGLIDRIPLLFTGKLAIKEMGVLAQLSEEGLVTQPEILPPNVADVRALASWMTLSNALNQIDLGEMELHLADALS